jgi:UDP-N-acetylglucosamine 2-epimerase (non-hydrolysing)
VFFDDLKIRKPDYFLEAATDSTAETIGNVIARSDSVMKEVQPDAVLVYGDTNSCLSAISAKRRKIPVFHMEAGNRCFDERVPEEINRRIVDHISDINMPLSERARQYLIREGISVERIIKTGSCIKEVLEYHRAEIHESAVLKRLELESRHYFVLSCHREENVDSPDNLRGLVDTINQVIEQYRLPIIFSVHPRTSKRLAELPSGLIDERAVQLKPLGYFDYVKLQMQALCVMSDSGTITEESSILSFPAVTIRDAHERPEGMDVGTLIMAPLKPDRVLDAIRVVLAHHLSGSRVFQIVPDYDVDNVSKKVVRIIHSYVDYVNRVVWGKV